MSSDIRKAAYDVLSHKIWGADTASATRLARECVDALQDAGLLSERADDLHGPATLAEANEILAQCARVMCLSCMATDHTMAEHERASEMTPTPEQRR